MRLQEVPVLRQLPVGLPAGRVLADDTASADEAPK